ncbi:hypothetical protein [Ralstonia sp. 25mfcol4.1]|uniref:hypothetical protein n=1 Tax=Ralstonia sp. 25mfcol4.1 TaxID=1761899 RepID=UPI001114576D|nr:hypothetical protein [Ralstonia sp. 25mfcol4.1]
MSTNLIPATSPVLNKTRYAAIAARRLELSEEAKKSKTGKIQAKVNFVVDAPKDGRCSVNGFVSIEGKKNDEKEFEISLEINALFRVAPECTDEQSESSEFHHFITAQLGPLVVTKARQLMEDIGISSNGLSFFNPFAGSVVPLDAPDQI